MSHSRLKGLDKKVAKHTIETRLEQIEQWERENPDKPKMTKEDKDAMNLAIHMSAGHSETYALSPLLDDLKEILDQLKPEDKRVTITTVGQWVCGYCIGRPGKTSGLADIAVAKGLGEVLIQSAPSEGVDGPFQSKGRVNTNITIKISKSFGKFGYKID